MQRDGRYWSWAFLYGNCRIWAPTQRHDPVLPTGLPSRRQAWLRRMCAVFAPARNGQSLQSMSAKIITSSVTSHVLID